MYKLWYIYINKHYLAIKRIFTALLINLQIILPMGRSQSKKITTSKLISATQNDKTVTMEKRLEIEMS